MGIDDNLKRHKFVKPLKFNYTDMLVFKIHQRLMPYI